MSWELAQAVLAALGALSDESFRQDFRRTVTDIDHHLSDIEAKVDQILEFLLTIPALLKGITADQFRAELSTLINARSKVLRDMEAPIKDFNHVPNRSDFVAFGRETSLNSYHLQEWGTAGYLHVSDAFLIAARCYIIGRAPRATIGEMATQHAVYFFEASKSFLMQSSQLATSAKHHRDEVDRFPKTCRIGTGKNGEEYYAYFRMVGNRYNSEASKFDPRDTRLNGIPDVPGGARPELTEEFAKELFGRIITYQLNAPLNTADLEEKQAAEAKAVSDDNKKIADGLRKWALHFPVRPELT